MRLLEGDESQDWNKVDITNCNTVSIIISDISSSRNYLQYYNKVKQQRVDVREKLKVFHFCYRILNECKRRWRQPSQMTLFSPKKSRTCSRKSEEKLILGRTAGVSTL